DDPDPTRRPRISVRREADPRLVGQRDDLETPRLPEPREETQNEVPRDAEQVGHPDLAQIGDEEVAERHGRAHGPARSATVADNSSEGLCPSPPSGEARRGPPLPAPRAPRAEAGSSVGLPS